MNKLDLIRIAEHFVENSEENIISEQNAISEKVIGMKIFEAPIFGFGAAEDEYFKLLKEPKAKITFYVLPSWT
jgi:epoxyqueuosine reductase